MAQRFQKRVEDFVCEHCGALVVGDGYTNHCPHCLWSRHVDQYPGDRLEECGGMMEPAVLEGSSPDYRIVHICKRCGARRINNAQPEDSTDALVALANHPHLPVGLAVDERTGDMLDPVAKEREAVQEIEHEEDRLKP